MVEAIGTWFAGIATAGSLWLGFTILRSDRNKEERDQAGKVAVFSKVLFWEPSHPEHGLQIQVRVWNNSPLPIIDPALYGIQPGDFMHFEFTTLRSDQPDEVLLPGESAKIEFKNMDHIDREQLL